MNTEEIIKKCNAMQNVQQNKHRESQKLYCNAKLQRVNTYLRTYSGVRMVQSTSSICSSRMKCDLHRLRRLFFIAHPIGPKSNWPVTPETTQNLNHICRLAFHSIILSFFTLGQPLCRRLKKSHQLLGLLRCTFL